MSELESTQFATVNVPIKKIVKNADFMMREGGQLDKKLVEQYKDNLAEITESNPIVVFDTPKGLLLVDGFHRLAAAQQLNWVEIKVQQYKGSWRDAFQFACLANLKHGKPLSRSERVHAIKEYIVLNVELSDRWIGNDTGQSHTTINNYRKELEAAGRITVVEKRLGQDEKERTGKVLPVEKVIEPFDKWFGEHVFQNDVFNVLPNDPLKYDLAIVDPPYGILNEAWDKQSKGELLDFTSKWLNLVLRRLKPSGRLFVFWSRKYFFELRPLFNDIKNEYELNFGGIIVWNFRNTMTVPNNRKELKITWEPLFYFYGSDAPELYRPDTKLTGEKWESIDSDVWTYALPQSNFSDTKVHPAQKPRELYEHIIQLSTKTNDLILDPFAGSGTTGHAAYLLGRDFRLIEKEEQYVNQIKERLRGVFKNGKS